MRSGLFLLPLIMACSGEGSVTLSLSLANNNARDILVGFAGEPRLFTVDNVIVIFEAVALSGKQETTLLEGLTPVVLRLDPTVEFISEVVQSDNFDSLTLTLGIADALAAANAEEPNVFGRSFHIQGTIDTDGDGLVETGIVVYAPAAQSLDLTQEIKLKPEQTINAELVLNLEALLSGVDFSNAEDVGAELALTEDNTIDQTPIVSSNVLQALTLLIN